MKSFGILRTNPGLTTNIKIMVDSNYRLSLDSIDSVPDLSASKFKKVSFNKDNLYDDLIPYFFDGLPAETAYEIKYDEDSKNTSAIFSYQYDEIYQYGARNIVNNKNYLEEYEYFAPLYIEKGSLPKYFVIFRVDGPGLINLDRHNFRDEILRKLKTVKLFDLTKTTALGQWLDKNIEDNDFFPQTPFEMNYDSMEFSVWKGINYVSGGYVEKSQFLDDALEDEKEIFEMEKFIFDGYKKNKVVFPNILNFSFLFDDTPADENRLRKWSMNRYYGFYIEELDAIKTISPYSPPPIKSDAQILDGNILQSPSGSPFVNGFRTDIPMYVEYNGEYYRVETYKEKQAPKLDATNTSSSTTGQKSSKGVTVSQGTLQDINKLTTDKYKKDEITEKEVDKFKIISDLDLTGKQSSLNKNTGTISPSKVLVDSESNPITIQDFDRADIWLIEIDNKYHNLVKRDDKIFVNSDYSFEFSENSYNYFINKNDKQYTTIISTLVNFNERPKTFKIYRVRLSNIMDFDTRIVDTEPSKFEYELKDQITNTQEDKMYFTDLNSTTIPKRRDVFVFRDKISYIPVSSEYTANQETFKIDEDELSPIWRKNSVYCRWAYRGSLSSNDYPYTLNNSRVFGPYNRTTNPYLSDPSRVERNLDYFYTINSSSNKYIHHTLHVERTTDTSIDRRFDFDLGNYLSTKELFSKGGQKISIDFDYFNHLFTLKSYFDENRVVKNTKKYSVFQAGDRETPNYTVFRGIKFALYDVVADGIKLNSANQISNINTELNNTFQDYKFSIILTSQDNGMIWDVIESWNPFTEFKRGDLVVHDEIMYVCNADTTFNSSHTYKDISIRQGINTINKVENVIAAPYNLLAYQDVIVSNSVKFKNLPGDNTLGSDWLFYEDVTIFWNPLRSFDSHPQQYKNGDVIYRDGSFYVMTNSSGTIDFWNPAVAMRTTSLTGTDARLGYQKGSIVYHRNRFYISKDESNIKSPLQSESWDQHNQTLSNFRWTKVEIWKPNMQYGSEITYVVHDQILYRTTTASDLIPSGTTPGRSPLWTRVYSLEADTDFVYKTDENPFIFHNDSIYRLMSNPNGKTLENGVRVFINHKYKNVLVNIFINDNTMSHIRDADRDLLYNKASSKLVAKNFIDHINGITRKNGFSDNLSYVVVSATGSVTNYGVGNNLTKMKHVLFAYGPEEFGMKYGSLIFKGVNEIRLKPTKSLTANKISTTSQLNYYSNTHIATEITANDDTATVAVPGTVETIYRFGGSYMPLFYEIELFSKDNSIDSNNVNLRLDISDIQSVTFEFNKDGSASQSVYTINPSVNYTNASDYWQQIVDIVNDRFPEIDFTYELLPKQKLSTGKEYISLVDKSYNKLKDIWYDSGKSGIFATPVPSNTIPKFLETDLYPGNNFFFNGTNNSLSFMRTNTIALPSSASFEFVVKSNEVGRFNVFFGNGSTMFGFANNRVFAVLPVVAGQGSSFNNPGVFSQPILQPNTWYHIVFNIRVTTPPGVDPLSPTTPKDTYMKVYIDGVDRTEPSQATINTPVSQGQVLPASYTNYPIMINASPAHIASKFAIGNYQDVEQLLGPFIVNFSGNVSSIRIHNQVLNEDEIASAFSSEHREFSIKYNSLEGEIRMNLYPEYPRLAIELIDTFDPSYPFFALKLGATGGNAPYKYSFNGGPYVETDLYTALPKNSIYTVSVNDVLGLSASNGYFRVNDDIDFETPIVNGTINY